MKNIIIISMILFLFSCGDFKLNSNDLKTYVLYSNTKNKQVLNKFILGKDSYSSVLNKLSSNLIDVYTEYDGNELRVLKTQFSIQHLNEADIEFVFINNALYSVRIFPCQSVDNRILKLDENINSKRYKKDLKKLNTELNNCNKFTENYIKTLNSDLYVYFTNQEWRNENIEVYYELDSDFTESFVHYDTELITLYPKYIGLYMKYL
jgi:hypothetical protein